MVNQQIKNAKNEKYPNYNQLKFRRLMFGLSQKQVACKAKISLRSYQAYEQEKQVPNVAVAIRIAYVLMSNCERLWCALESESLGIEKGNNNTEESVQTLLDATNYSSIEKLEKIERIVRNRGGIKMADSQIESLLSLLGDGHSEDNLDVNSVQNATDFVEMVIRESEMSE